MMTKLTKQMQKYLISMYQNRPWIERFFWELRLLRMSDGEIIKTYRMFTDGR